MLAEHGRIGAREIRIWGLAIVAAAFWSNVVRSTYLSNSSLALAVVDGVLSTGAFHAFAWSILFISAVKIPNGTHASLRQVASIFLLGFITLVPAWPAVVIALAGLAALFATDRRIRGGGRSAGLVLIALAIDMVWRSPLVDPLHVFVGSLDAHTCASLLRFLGRISGAHGNVVDNFSANFAIVILPLCTSSLPFSGVTLAFLLMVWYRDQMLLMRHIPWLCLALFASFLLTEVRLVLLVMSGASYEWWHNGPGVSIYGLAAVCLAVWCPIWATWDAGSSSNEISKKFAA